MNKNVLAAALARAAKVNPQGFTARKIRDEVLLTIDDQVLVVTCQGPLAKIRVRVPHGMLAPAKGSRAVSLGLLTKLCAAYEASAELELGFAGETFRVKSGKRSQEFTTEEGDTYIFQARAAGSMQVKLSDIVGALDSVKASVAVGEVNNPTFKGIRLVVKDKVGTAISVDGYRGLVRRFPCDAPDLDVLVPPQAISILELLDGGETPFAALQVEGSWMSITTMDCDVDIRLIDGIQPDVLKLVGDTAQRAQAACRVGRLDLLTAMNAAALAAGPKGRIALEMKGSLGKAVISATSDVAQFKTSIEASGADLGDLGLNVKYGLDALKALPGEHAWLAGELAMIVMSDDFTAAQNLACMAGMRA